MIKEKKIPVVLAILDGWGIGKKYPGNAIELAKTPNYKALTTRYPYTELLASGSAVGLPVGQDGNSEAGHMNIGAGRIVSQDAVAVNNSIKNGVFFKNAAFLAAVKNVRKNKSTFHLMGLLSDNNSPHVSPSHIYTLLDFLAKHKVKNIVLHLFTDGRDSFQHAALGMLQELTSHFCNGEKIGTVMGRFYGMERNKRWQYTEKAYDALVLGRAESFQRAEDVIERAYNRGETDEFIKPSVIGQSQASIKRTRIKSNDSVVFFNLRSDRARQIAKCFVQTDFNERNPRSFKRKKVLQNLTFVALTDFGPDLDTILTAFPSKDIKKTLPLALIGKKHFYIAESEKYAHVTYFFNGGYAQPVGGGEWYKVPSPQVKHYDEQPAMSAVKITKNVVARLEKNQYDFYCLNYANPDMVAHTGNLAASVLACQAVDFELGKLAKAVLKIKGHLIITADHGNAEELLDPKTGEIDTKHSTNPVPFCVVSAAYQKHRLRARRQGVLGDIAPTTLELLAISQPSLMKGKSLWK